jgi:hypothetical protein
MLSAKWVSGYQRFYDAFVPSVMQQGLRYRIEETNSFYNGGAPAVSNTFASALWGLDFLHWWAAHGAAGINFHTGDSVAAGESTGPCHYAVFTAADSGIHVRPLGYALRAFALGSKGTTVPVVCPANPDHINLTCYGVLEEYGPLVLTLISKEITGDTTLVSIEPGKKFRSATAMFLEAPVPSATDGIRLGGSEITDDQRWSGSWTTVRPGSQDGEFTLTLPASTAAIVRLTAQ